MKKGEYSKEINSEKGQLLDETENFQNENPSFILLSSPHARDCIWIYLSKMLRPIFRWAQSDNNNKEESEKNMELL